jgi:hypothetical protein
MQLVEVDKKLTIMIIKSVNVINYRVIHQEKTQRWQDKSSRYFKGIAGFYCKSHIIFNAKEFCN